MTTGPDESDRLWAALGDPMRIRLLDLLLELGEATASTLAGALPITRQGVSKHLNVLERDGFVTSRRNRPRSPLRRARGSPRSSPRRAGPNRNAMGRAPDCDQEAGRANRAGFALGLVTVA